MKKVFSALILVCVMISGAWGSVHINEETFPDFAFRVMVSMDFDKDQDQELSDAEIAEATSIIKPGFTAYGLEMKSMRGIEYLTSLVSLDC